MGSTRTHQEQPIQKILDSNIEKLSVARTPGIDSILLTYSRLPKDEISVVHVQQFAAARDVLWNAVDAYSEEMNYLSQSGVSPYKVQRVTDDYQRFIDSARRLDFPAIALKPISFEFIDVALNYEKNIAPHVRDAIKEMALAIGNDKVFDAKVRYIAESHLGTLEAARGKTLSDAQSQRVIAAEGMLSDLGFDIGTERIPSVVNNLADFTKKHGRSVALTGTIAIISSSLLAPSMAAASEVPKSNTTVSAATAVESGSIDTLVGMPSPELEPKTASIIIASGSADVTTEKTVNATVSLSVGPETRKKQASVPISATSNVSEKKTTIPVVMATDAKTDTSSETPISVTTPSPSAETNKNASIVIDSETITVPEVPLTTNGDPVPTNPVAINTENINTAPKLDKETATPEQLAIQAITNTIHSDGDISMAASIIRLKFHNKDEVVSSYKNGQPVYVTTNPVLLKNIIGLEITYEDLIAKSGHADANYVNNTLTALAVFEAAANDQSVLSSPDIQKLVADIKRPDDEYRGKLYDQFVSKAKDLLAANDSAFLAGINDQYKAQLETMYSYILMANVSDIDQVTQIQAIKDTEAAAAAAAKAAAEKAAADQAASAAVGINTMSSGAEALKNLHDREQNPAKQRTFYALNYLMVHGGLNATQAAGVIGNLLVESASSMNPSIIQFGGGPAKGIAQWEAGRLVALENYAVSKGKAWDDFDTQLDFLISELDGRQNTLERLKGSQNLFDATNNFMIHFETPNVVVRAQNTGDWTKANQQAKTRTDRGQPILDAYNAEEKGVNDARTAAAESERQAKQAKGMNLAEAVAFMDSYKNNPDNAQYIGEAGSTCNGGPLSNCVSFSVYFANKFTTIKDMGKGFLPGMGGTVVKTILSRNPSVESGNDARVDAIFSTTKGSQNCGNIKCGHTGVILGVDVARGKVIVGEAGCAAPGRWDTAREYDLEKFNSGSYTYAYTNNILKAEVK